MGDRAGFQLGQVEDDFTVGAQGAVQNLIQRGAAQWAGLLLQGGQRGHFLAGHEAAVGGDQQDRCGSGR